MKKVLLFQTNLQPPGGGSAVAAWMIEALKKDYSVSILTWKPPDFEEINRFYGTSLSGSEIDIHCVNPILRSIISLDPDVGSFQKTSYLMRVCKRVGKDYDVIVSADNEIDFGRRGIQYFHYPYMHEKMRPNTDISRRSKLGGLFNGSYRPWMLISGFSYDRMVNNLTLVNSDWTGIKAKEFYGIDAITVYPPVSGDFPDVSWEEKKNGFVCIGRFHPVKRFEKIVQILFEVKKKIQDIRLHIVGTKANESYAYDYYEGLKSLAKASASWIHLHENMSRAQLLELVAGHRYGIHGHLEEHFGIAVAEMLKAGCIPFVPNGGGQVEIVGGDRRLIYANEKEAVEKIVRIISNPEERASIRSYLDSRKELFSTEKFISHIREVVRQFGETAY